MRRQMWMPLEKAEMADPVETTIIITIKLL
jgi:hypothetical protein